MDRDSKFGSVEKCLLILLLYKGRTVRHESKFSEKKRQQASAVENRKGKLHPNVRKKIFNFNSSSLIRIEEVLSTQSTKSFSAHLVESI